MSDFLITETKRCLQCKNPQCMEGCPVKFNVPEFLRLAGNGEFDRATQVVGHLFGEVCGYVCPRGEQCQGHCVLSVRSNGVDVGGVERRVFEQYFPTLQVQNKSLLHLKVAVVGGGVSGLTFAGLCYECGASVTVFERNQLLHTLRSIPNFRLPVSALDKILQAFQNSGITIKKADIKACDVEKLKSQYSVVYLATGVSLPNKMHVEGEEYATSADEFLRSPSCGQAVVIGGGNTAMDCARKNARAGFKTIVAYRRSKQDMPAFPSEIAAAEEDGVEFLFNVAPVCVNKEGDLNVVFAKTVSEGRGKLVLTDQIVQLSCQNLVVATGNRYDEAVYPSNLLHVDDQNNAGQNLYAGGDAVGKNLVAQAVADAQNAFRAVSKKYQR